MGHHSPPGRKIRRQSNNVLLCIIIIMKILSNCRKGSYPSSQSSMEALSCWHSWEDRPSTKDQSPWDLFAACTSEGHVWRPQDHSVGLGLCFYLTWGWMIKPSSPGLFARRDPLPAEPFCWPQGSLEITWILRILFAIIAYLFIFAVPAPRRTLICVWSLKLHGEHNLEACGHSLSWESKLGWRPLSTFRLTSAIISSSFLSQPLYFFNIGNYQGDSKVET